MVVRSKSEAKKEFSRRLRSEIQARFPDAPTSRGLVRWLEQLLKTHAKSAKSPVSYETCRKWLNAKDIPVSANLMMLCDATKIQVTDLMDEEIRAYVDEQEDPDILKLVSKFKQLKEPSGRKHVLEALDFAIHAETPDMPMRKRSAR